MDADCALLRTPDRGTDVFTPNPVPVYTRVDCAMIVDGEVPVAVRTAPCVGFVMETLGPVGPVPKGPVFPVGPVMPVAPVGPVIPVGPVAPVAPVGP